MPHEPGPDGVARSPAEQSRINEQLALAFRGASGKAALDYLRSISIERVCGPFAGDAELRHLEGMRFIVAIISQRIAAHHREQSNAGAASPAPAGASAAIPSTAAALAARRQRKRPLPG
jgi:hypothetical protein